MEFLQLCWSFLCSVVIQAWGLIESAALFAWELLTVLHVEHPRLEGLVIGITLAWLMTRRERHPIVKALSAPLKLIIDILDLIWDHCVEFLSDVWQWHLGHWKRLGGWIASGYGWCKSKVVGVWTWSIDGLKSIKDKLVKKEDKE